MINSGKNKKNIALISLLPEEKHGVKKLSASDFGAGDNILALNAIKADTSATIIKGGEIVSCVQEERFNRQKRTDDFPRLAIKFCLAESAMCWKDLDIVFWQKTYHPEALYYLQFKKNQMKIIKANGFHHLAHGGSSFRLSGFKKANILVIDAKGDDNDSITFFIGNDGKIRKRWRVDCNKISLGDIYERAALKIGLASNASFAARHGQGKMMALSAYGKPSSNYKDIFYIKDHKNVVDNSREYISSISRKASKRKIPHVEVITFTANIQKCLEDSVINLI
ncbi:MAG: carbamoyltransferase N-terminal domain-containing protein, partial [Candidatus Omnitrophota bacterium]